MERAERLCNQVKGAGSSGRRRRMSKTGRQSAARIWVSLLLLLLYSAVSSQEGGPHVGEEAEAQLSDFGQQGSWGGLLLQLRGAQHEEESRSSANGAESSEAATLLHAGQDFSVVFGENTGWSIQPQWDEGRGGEGGGVGGEGGGIKEGGQEEKKLWDLSGTSDAMGNELGRWIDEASLESRRRLSSRLENGDGDGEGEGEGEGEEEGGGEWVGGMGIVHQHRFGGVGRLQRLEGLTGDGGEVRMQLTRAGGYILKVWPRQLTSAGRHLLAAAQYVLKVTPGATYGPNCVLCYIPFFPGINETDLLAQFPNDDFRRDQTRDEIITSYGAESSMARECLVNNLNNTVPFRADAVPLSNLTEWNTDFPLCQKRICITFQVRRYDAWGNPVSLLDVNGTVMVDALNDGRPPADGSDVITTELFGVEDGVDTLDPFNNGTLTYISTQSPDKYEAWAHGAGNYTEPGPLRCNTHLCPLIKLVGPNSFVQTWITVRINGSPIGYGNPVFTRTVPGAFARFGLSVNRINGSITPRTDSPPGSGPILRVYPADRNGIIMADTFAKPCVLPWPEAPYLSRVGSASSWCRQQAMEMLSRLSVKFECVEDVGDRTVAVPRLKPTGGNPEDIINVVFRPRDNCTDAGCDEVPDGESLPDACSTCEWLDESDKAIEFEMRTTTAALCKVSMMFQGPAPYGIDPVLVPEPTPVVTPPSWTYGGGALGEGQYTIRISAGPPTATFSSKLSNKTTEGTVSPTRTTIKLDMVLRDEFGNPKSDGSTSFRTILTGDGIPATVLDDPVYDERTAVWIVSKNVTVSGNYFAQVLLAPSFDAMWGSPFRILVHPDYPIASNTLFIQAETTAVVGIPAAFYIQLRDVYLNLVSSVASEYFSPGKWDGVPNNNLAPGFWIWAAPINDQGDIIGKPVLDATGTRILRCPDMCAGVDPGFGSLKAGFSADAPGLYDIKLQFCDPAANAGPRGIVCFALSPDAYDLTRANPPLPPNPCNDIPAGEPGSPRFGYACEIGDHIRFKVEATPDRIVPARSEVIVPEEMKVGLTYAIEVKPKDRLLRNAALATTRCRYVFSFFDEVSGNCVLNAADRTFTVPFAPNVSGVYNISVFLDEAIVTPWDLSAIVTASIDNVDHDRTTAVGLGLSLAAAGINNTFNIQLRDKWGGHIKVGKFKPLAGERFFEDCGYPYIDLPSGELTSGYGLVGDDLFGILATEWGCRYAFHTYLVDGDGQIIRPVKGFRVKEIEDLVDGSVSVVYDIDEPGEFTMYARYLPYNNAGQLLFNASGRLSLESMSTSREGQIHGSPFRIKVLPSIADSDKSEAKGPGLEYAVINKAELSRFDVVARDSFNSLTRCDAKEVSVTVLDPAGVAVDDIEVYSGTDLKTECHVTYNTQTTGVHTVSVNIFDRPVPASPFYPSVYVSSGLPSDTRSFARFIFPLSAAPCYEYLPRECSAWVTAGGNVSVAVSVRDALGALPDDGYTTFKAQVQGPDVWSTELTTVRETVGEHTAGFAPTRSGTYTISVKMGPVTIPIMPEAENSASFRVLPGPLHGPSSTMSGSGLTVATAGVVSRFLIVGRDQYGNGISPNPSPNPTEAMPGRGKIQVVIRGEGNATVYGSVSDAGNGSFTVGYTLVAMAKYSMEVSLLDEPPGPISSRVALERRGNFQDGFDPIIRPFAGGQHMSRQSQPWVVSMHAGRATVLSDAALASSSGAVCDGPGSLAYLSRAFPSEGVVAGQVFGVSVYFIDACGNPTVPPAGSDVNLNIIGPIAVLQPNNGALLNGAVYPPGVDLDSIVASPSTFNASTIASLPARMSHVQALAGTADTWEGTAALTVSGSYAIRVTFRGEDVAGGIFRLNVASREFSPSPAETVLSGLEPGTDGTVLRRADGFSFTVQPRDIYGNIMSRGETVLVAYATPIISDNTADGSFVAEVEVSGKGIYSVSVPRLSVSGPHDVAVLANGQHVMGSPLRVRVAGGKMVQGITDATFGSFMGEPFPNQQRKASASTYAASRFSVSVLGRDLIGLPTRLGVDDLELALHHTGVDQDLTPTPEQLKATRTLSVCLYANITFDGSMIPEALCDTNSTYNGTMPLFSYEVQRDGVDRASFVYDWRANVTCRSADGYDNEARIWDNLMEVMREEIRFTTEDNVTTNETFMISEMHPIVELNARQCAVECSRRDCSCATHIWVNESDYRRGTCILYSGEFFLEEDSGKGEKDGTWGIFPESVSRDRWFETRPDEPIYLWVYARLVGEALLSITLGGHHIRGSPYPLNIIPGPYMSAEQSALALEIDVQPGVAIPEIPPPTQNVLSAVAGLNFSVVYNVKDSFGNPFVLTQPWETELTVAFAEFAPSTGSGAAFGGNMTLVNDTAFTVPFRPVSAGTYRPSIKINNIPLNGSLPTIKVFPSKTVTSGNTATASPSSCVAPCPFSVQIPADPYGNQLDVSCSFYALRQNNAHAPVVSPQYADNVTVSGEMIRTFNVTTAGELFIRCDFSKSTPTSPIEEIPGSPFTLSIDAAAMSAGSTEVLGSGILGAVLGAASSFDIQPKDVFGNSVGCNQSLLSITSALSIAVIVGPTACTASYTPSSAGSFTVGVVYAGETVANANVQVISDARPATSMSLNCAFTTASADAPPLQVFPCSGVEIDPGVPSRMRFETSFLDQDGIPANLDTLRNLTLLIMHCRLPLSDAVGTRSCIFPYANYSYVWPQSGNGTTAWTLEDPGSLSVDFELESTGAYFLSLTGNTTADLGSWQASSAFLGAAPTLEDPWLITVFPGNSSANMSTARGPGMERARLAEVARAQIEDRDSLNNLRVGQDAGFTAAATLTAAGGGSISIPVSVSPRLLCAEGVDCIHSGIYDLSYIIPAAEACQLIPAGCTQRTGPGGQQGTLQLTIMRSGQTVLARGVVVDFLVAAYSPAYAYAAVNPPVSIIAGLSYTVRVQPRNALGSRPPTSERLGIVMTPDQPYTIDQDSDAYFLKVSITAGGTYSIRVLDGLADIVGSPFSISVVPAAPDPETVVISGPGAVTAFVGEITTFSVLLRDAYGNVVREGISRTSSNAFLSHEFGLQDTQAFTQLEGFGELLTYTPRLTGKYRLVLTIDGSPAKGALIQATRKVLADGTSTVTVLADGASGTNSFFTGEAGFTTATAGVAMSFTISARDYYGNKRTVWGDPFFATLSYLDASDSKPISCSITDNVYEKVEAEVNKAKRGEATSLRPGCMVGCSIPYPTYKAVCMATRSGRYSLRVTNGMVDVTGSPVETYVKYNVLSHHTTKLLQEDPVKSWLPINLIQTYATANLVDGAYTLSVGTNSLRIVALDDYGNRVPARLSKAEVGKEHKFQARVVKLEAAPNGNGGFTYVPEEDAEGGVVAVEGGSGVNGTNGTTAVVVSTGDTTDMSTKPTYVPCFFSPVAGVEGGDYEVSFTITSAGKYRINVYIDSKQIARHVPIEELRSSSTGQTISRPDCCVPAKGKCPSAVGNVQVCGDLFTVLPGPVSHFNTFVVGNTSREFRFAVPIEEGGGDGNGNEDYPVYDLKAVDVYGNPLTYASNEFYVMIRRMNDTIVETQRAVSLQPEAPDQLCRASPPNSLCGAHQYAWTGIAASISGRYKIEISYNGKIIGPSPIYQTMRSGLPQSRDALIYGPGLEVNIPNELTYFYFRPFDQMGNPWEPDGVVADKPVNVDFAQPLVYGLGEGQKLRLDQQPGATTPTRMYYYGYGLFKVEYESLPAYVDVFGNVAIYYGTVPLATPAPGRAFQPITLRESYEFNTPYEITQLHPIASRSFATGAGLYPHFAGDLVEVTAHGVSDYTKFGSYTWPGIGYEPGKFFRISVRGPPGVSTLNFIPDQSSRFRWDWISSYQLTVGGTYSVSVTYAGEHVQGDGSSGSKVLEKSPYTLQVYGAPADPLAASLHGDGLSRARVGEVATFELATRDIFGNLIGPHLMNLYKGDVVANASLIGTVGHVIPVEVLSLGDGRSRGKYIVTQSGQYSLTVMVNGISITVPPLSVTASIGLASPEYSSFVVVYGGAMAQLCVIDPTPEAYIDGVDTIPRVSPQCPASVRAGLSFAVRVDARDCVNNTLSLDTQAPVSVIMEGTGRLVSTVVRSKEFSRYESFLSATVAGTYKVSVSLSGVQLVGSPVMIQVAAAAVRAQASSMSGSGLFDTFVGKTVIINVRGYDMYGNPVTLQGVPLEASVTGINDPSLPSVANLPSVDVITSVGFTTQISYALSAPGSYAVNVRLMSEGSMVLVPGSGAVVSSTKRPAPRVEKAMMNDALDGIDLEFQIATDMACSAGKTHTQCADFVSSSPTVDACCDYFDDATCASLGSLSAMFPAKCVWENPSRMTITLGTGATVRPLQVLKLRPIIRSSDGWSYPITLPIVLAEPETMIPPLAVLLANAAESECDDVVLDASGSSGSGGRPMEYSWAVQSGLKQNQGLKDFLASQPTTASVVTIPAGTTPQGTHTFIVSVQNFLGLRGSSNMTLIMNSGPVLGVQAASSLINTALQNDVTLFAYVKTSQCHVFTDMEFRWSLTSGLSLDLDSNALTSTSLLLPAYSLVPGGVYTFEFRAQGLSEGLTRTSSIEVMVVVTPSKLQVVIAGGDSKVYEGSPIKLDASASIDPEGIQGVAWHYYWMCAPVLRFIGDPNVRLGETSNSSCFFDTNGVLLRDSSILSLTSGELLATATSCPDCLPGVYNFTVNVTKDGLNGAMLRWSSTHVLITVLPRPNVVGLLPVPAVVNRVGSRVSPSQVVRLEAGLTTTVEPSEIVYSWSVVNVEGYCCLGKLNMTNGSAFPTGVQSTSLIIKPGGLAPGIQYVFRFSARHMPSGVESSADMMIEVNSPPKAGTFEVAPSSGIGGSTRFSFECSLWTDDPDDFPMSFSFVASGLFDGDYDELSVSLSTSTTGLSDRILPSVDAPRNLVISALISDMHGAAVRVEAPVALASPPNFPPEPQDAVAAALALRAGPLKVAVDLNRVNAAYETADMASSILNSVIMNTSSSSSSSSAAAAARRGATKSASMGASPSPRRVAAPADEIAMASIRENVLKDVLSIARSMAFTQHDVDAMAVTLRYLTAVPSQLNSGAINAVLDLLEILAKQGKRFPFSRDFLWSACDAISAVNIGAHRLAYTVKSPTSHRISRDWIYRMLVLLQSVGRSSVVKITPDEEALVALAETFDLNIRRVKLLNVLGSASAFGVDTLLPSQERINSLTSPSRIRLQDGFISRGGDGNITFLVDQTGYVYGTRPYPEVVYAPGGYPASLQPQAVVPIRSREFGPTPTVLEPLLNQPFLDIQVAEWIRNPFDVAERGLSETNVASLPLGRAKSVMCSSVLQDCSDTGGICTPPKVEGSQGPSHQDTACARAFDDNDETSWAVNPASVKRGGSGSWAVIELANAAFVSALKYKQRRGPKYCSGSAGEACVASNSTCECVIGGDKELMFNFSDGSSQRVTLQPTYDFQYFELIPVETTSVRITVMSVYSDSSTCPSRFACPWWEPICNNGCPNGAETIDFIALQSWEEVYDYGRGYMNNYSMLAARVSRTTSLSLWQSETHVNVTGSRQPLLLNSTILPHNYTLNDQVLALCRSWDRSRARWSSRGVVNTGRVVKGPTSYEGAASVHECSAFYTADFTLVLREYPVSHVLSDLDSNTMEFGELDMNALYNFAVFVFFLGAWLVWCAFSIWAFLRWLESWRVATIEYLKRQRQALAEAELERQGIRQPKPVEAPPLHQEYYAIIGILNSNVISSKGCDTRHLWQHNKYHCLSRWSYLYAILTKSDDLPYFARFTCLFILVSSSFAVNAMLLATGDTSTIEWYWAPWRCCCFTLCMAQLLPGIYRCVSKLHSGWDPSEVTDVYSVETKKTRPVFGAGGTEKKTRLKSLRRKLGEAVIVNMVKKEKGDEMSLDDYDANADYGGGAWLQQDYESSPVRADMSVLKSPDGAELTSSHSRTSRVLFSSSQGARHFDESGPPLISSAAPRSPTARSPAADASSPMATSPGRVAAAGAFGVVAGSSFGSPGKQTRVISPSMIRSATASPEKDQLSTAASRGPKLALLQSQQDDWGIEVNNTQMPSAAPKLGGWVAPPPPPQRQHRDGGSAGAVAAGAAAAHDDDAGGVGVTDTGGGVWIAGSSFGATNVETQGASVGGAAGATPPRGPGGGVPPGGGDLQISDLEDVEDQGETPRLGDSFRPVFHATIGFSRPAPPRVLPPLSPPPSVSRDALQQNSQSGGGAGATLRMGGGSSPEKSSPGKTAPVLGSLQKTATLLEGMDGMASDGTMFGARPTSMKAFIRAHASEGKAAVGAARFKERAKALKALQEEKARVAAKEAEQRAREEAARKRRESTATAAAAAAAASTNDGIRSEASLSDGRMASAAGRRASMASQASRRASTADGGPDQSDADANAGEKTHEDEGSRPATSTLSRPVTSPSRPVTSPSCPSTRGSGMLYPGLDQGGVDRPHTGDKRVASPSQLDIAWDRLLEAERRREQEAKDREKEQKEALREQARLEGREEEYSSPVGPPPPPQKEEEQPPSPPGGRPPRILNRYQERRILRLLRKQRDQSEIVYFRSWLRKTVYYTLFGRTTRMWGVEARPQYEMFFPRWMYSFVYACMVVCLIMSFLVLFIYSADFDDAIMNAWIYSSITSLFAELCVSQPGVALIHAWWLGSNGRVWLLTSLAQWATTRTDILPPFG